MERAIRGLMALAIGLPLAAGGIAMIGWTFITVNHMHGGYETALFVAENWPIALGAPPQRFALAATASEMAVYVGLLGLVAYLLGAGILRRAFGRGPPADLSGDGLARIELATAEPRVGHPIEGRLRVLKNSQPGEMFNLTLRCRR